MSSEETVGQAENTAAADACRPYMASPSLQFTLPMSNAVFGATWCDDKLFIACLHSNTITVLGPNNERLDDIEVNELEAPCDIVSCTETQQLYIVDESPDALGVWRVSLDGRQVVKFLPNQSTTASEFSALTLSVTSRRLLVTSRDKELSLYGADGVELKRLPLPDMTLLRHAVETSRGTFIVSHTLPQPRVCEINVDGHVISVFSDEQRPFCPMYMSLDSDGRIFVADCDNDRVLLLNSETLELEHVLLDKLQQQQLASGPSQLCFKEKTGQLAVCSFEYYGEDAVDKWSGCVQLFTVR